jgi:hypothetical protein
MLRNCLVQRFVISCLISSVMVFHIACGRNFEQKESLTTNQQQTQSEEKREPIQEKVMTEEEGIEVCNKRKARILAVVMKIQQIRVAFTRKKEPSVEDAEKRDKKIYQLIDSIADHADDVLALAKITRALSKHCGIDNGEYEVSFFYCVGILATKYKNDTWAKEQLVRLRDTSELNDTDSVEFKAIVEGRPFP